jgi:hypothetical protein
MKEGIDLLTKIMKDFQTLNDIAGELIELIKTQEEKKNFTAKMGRTILRMTGMGTNRAKFKGYIKLEKSKIEAIKQQCDNHITISKNIHHSLTSKPDIKTLGTEINKQTGDYNKLRKKLSKWGESFFKKCEGETKCKKLLTYRIGTLRSKLNNEKVKGSDFEGVAIVGGSKRKTLRKKYYTIV